MKNIKEKFKMNGSYKYIGPSELGRGQRYLVQRILKMKNPNTREWEVAVLYTDRKADNFYVREINEFKSKFELIE